MSDTELPTGPQLAWPTLEAIVELGGSATIQEIEDSVAARLNLSDDQRAILRSDGATSEFYMRLASARTYLRAAGALERSRRGVWAITDAGRQLTSDDMQGITTAYQTQWRERRRSQDASDGDAAETGSDVKVGASAAEDHDWKSELLGLMGAMEPSAFERLSRRLLREAGFENTVVTGGSGDGGIDGVGIYRLSLVSFPVFFQCKRYRGSVTAGAVRDFRGAMQGRGDRGLLITTGPFTEDAKREATRAGAPPIDLIDGDRLCDLLSEYGVGVHTETRTVVKISTEFFADI